MTRTPNTRILFVLGLILAILGPAAMAAGRHSSSWTRDRVGHGA